MAPRGPEGPEERVHRLHRPGLDGHAPAESAQADGSRERATGRIVTTRLAMAAGAVTTALTPTSMLNGYTASALVYAFERIGLWTLLATRDGRTVDELAAGLSLDRARLAAMVDAARKLDILAVDAEGCIWLRELGRSLLVEKSRF